MYTYLSLWLYRCLCLRLYNQKIISLGTRKFLLFPEDSYNEKNYPLLRAPSDIIKSVCLVLDMASGLMHDKVVYINIAFSWRRSVFPCTARPHWTPNRVTTTNTIFQHVTTFLRRLGMAMKRSKHRIVHVDGNGIGTFAFLLLQNPL